MMSRYEEHRDDADEERSGAGTGTAGGREGEEQACRKQESEAKAAACIYNI